MTEYRVQFAHHWSEKNGDEPPSEQVMTLEDARRWIASHPGVDYVILQRTRTVGAEPSLWTVFE
ncbi:hypothetical protein ACFWZW_06490 [Microbacterium enclense]|uniref:hypothetical protein n=1 Tax=Microbacterium enclense TaxID=993073 RepID=UPI0036DAF2C0